MSNTANGIILKETTFEINQAQIRCVLMDLFNRTFLLWIGDNFNLHNLSLSVTGSVSTILADDDQSFGDRLALKLSARYTDLRPFYVSCNLSENLITNHVYLQLNQHVQNFLDKHFGKIVPTMADDLLASSASLQLD